MTTLEQHFTYLELSRLAARAAPLSARKAMLAAMLIDAYPDRLFAAGNTGAEDILAFRAALAAGSGALALVFALCALRDNGPRLVTEPVEVPIEDYPTLGVEDFMVSLYNDRNVPRVRIATADGGRHDVHKVLEEAVAALRTAQS